MNKPKIEPCLKLSGSACYGNTINSTRPIAFIYADESRSRKKDCLHIVKLSDWCSSNFISSKIGYRLIKMKYLLAVRRHHIWWVAANPDCLDQLLDYLGVEQLFFDADN